MAQKFVLTAALNIQAPNMNKVVRNINQQLQGVSVNLNVPNAAKTNKAIQNVNKNLKNTAKDAKVAATSMQKLGASIGSTIGQFIKYDIARAAINLFSRAITDGLSDAIKFEREMVKIAQVTGATAGKLKDLEKSITRVSTEFGVASMSLLQASRVLSQTGKSAEDVKIALESLAKTTLAPTFDSLIDTTETAIAVMAQFKIEAKDLERVLGSINAVAGRFAVEAGDLGVAIKRAGGAFRSAGGEVNELIALFTSVRATTRETAETIATGFRTIFTRLQRPTTIKFLRQFGVELQDLNGKFVGPYEAVRKLHLVLKDLDPRDVRYSQIVEQLGGFRQVSKVIPLIQQFQDAQSALNVAQAGGNSLAIDAAKAQDTFAVKITKLKEEVKELFRVISESDAFRVMLDGAIGLAKALTNVATALGPIIPMLTAMFAIKGIGALGSIGRNIGRGISTQGGRAFARGGIVPGTGTGDTVPAMLTPGEFVIRKKAVKAFGAGGLAEINKYAKGGKIEATGKGLRKYGYGVGLLFNKEGDRDWDKNKGRRWKESGSVVNQFGLTDSFKATNVIKRVDLDARTFRNKKIEPYVLAYQQAGKKNKLAQGIAWEKVLTESGKMSKTKGVQGRPLDGKMGDQIGDAALSTSSHTASAMAEKLFRHRYLSESNFLTNRKASYGRDNYNLGTVAEFIPSGATKAKLDAYGKPKKKPKPKRPRGATGGMLTAQGTDSIPAMLTPGEFVVNKKSAQAIGYNKLHTINGYASGGVVGGGKRAKMFMGGDPMSSLMMMFGMGMGGGGGGGGATQTSATNNASSALNGLAKQANTTSGTFKSGFGAVTSGLGNVATASLMAYSKVQFFGAALDSTITAMGIENETVHKVVGGLTDFVSWIYTASVALQALQSTQILQGLGNMFGSIGGPAIANAIGSPLRDMMTWIIGEKIMKGAGKRVGRARRGMGRFGRDMAEGADFTRLRRKGLSVDDMMGRSRKLGSEAQRQFRMSRIRQAGGLADEAAEMTARGRQLASGAGRYSRAASAGRRAAGMGQVGRLGKMLKNPFNIATVAITAFTLAVGASTSSQEELNEKMQNADSWEDVAETARSRAVGAGLEGVGTAGMANIATKVALKVGTKMLAAKGVRMAAGAGATGGLNMAVEIPLLVAELAYGVAMATDTMNNAIADFDSAQFAKKQQELGVAFDAFKDGTLSSAAMSTKLASVNSENADRSAQIARDQDTGRMGMAGAWGEGGSFDVMVDAFKGGDWVSVIGAGFATAAQTMLSIVSLGTIDIANAMGARGFWGRDDELIQADIESQGRAKVEQRAMAPEIAAGAMQSALESMRKGDGTAATGVDAFERAMGGAENLALVAKLMGMSADALRKKFKEQAEELEPIIKAQKEFEAAQLEMARSTRAAVDIMLGIMSIAPQIAALEANIANTMSGFAGGISSAHIVNKAPQFSNDALAAISTPDQWNDLKANVESVTGFLGVAGQQIKDEFLGGAQVMSFLPDALETLKSDITNLTGDTDDAGERVLDEIRNRIEDSGGDWDKIPETIKNRIRAKINSLDINAENFDENMAAILDDAGAAFAPYTTALQEAAEAVHKYNKMYGAALAQRNQMEMSFIQGQMKVLQLQQSGEAMIREATGGELTAADSAAAFKAQQQTLLGGGSGLAGGAVTGPGGGLASELGVAELGNLYVDQKKRLAELNKEIAASTGTTKDEALAAKKLQDEHAELTKQTEQTKQALQNYTDVQKRAAGIQAELSREQEARKTKRGVLSDFAFADDAGRASQIKGMQSAFTAIQAGDLGAVSEDQRGAVGAFLDKFENISLGAFGGKTGGDIKKELEIKELEKVMGRALSGDEKKQIMESTTKEDKLINDLRALNEEAITAQEDLNDGIKVSIDEMNTNLAELNKKFLDDLRDIFGARQEQRLKAEERKANVGIADATKDLANANAALEMVGLGGLQGEERDSALKTLTQNKELLANAKAAQDKRKQMLEGQKRLQQLFGGAKLGEMEDKIQHRMGAANEHTNQTMEKVTMAVEAQTQAMAGTLAPGQAKEKALSASAGITAVFEKLQSGTMTVQEAAGDDAMALKAFTQMGYEKEDKIDSMDANHIAGIIDKYMSYQMSSGVSEAENVISTLKTALEANPLFTQEVIDKVLGNSEGLTERLESLLPEETFTKLNERLNSFSQSIKDITDARNEIKAAGYSGSEPKPLEAIYEATGGPIYASRGMFIPKGTDTVPAMLTPGEFVIRRNAVKAVGMPLLQRINSMGRGGRQGGNGYYANGGNVSGGLALDFSGLDNSINKFSQQITRLGDALSGGFSINVGGEININVRLNGAEMLEGAKDALGQVAADKVEKGITRMLKRHFPKLNNKSGLHRIKE